MTVTIFFMKKCLAYFIVSLVMSLFSYNRSSRVIVWSSAQHNLVIRYNMDQNLLRKRDKNLKLFFQFLWHVELNVQALYNMVLKPLKFF
jgi:hypothetical protein